MRGIEKMKVSQHKNLANNAVKKAVSGQMKPYFKALLTIKIKKRRKKEMSQGDAKSKLVWNVTNNERRNIHTGRLKWEHKS